jgi:hypothetical protein
MASLEILRRRTIKVFDPCIDLRPLSDEEVWGEDPIHPTEMAFEKIAASVAKVGLREGAKRARTDSLKAAVTPAPDARRGLRDSD